MTESQITVDGSLAFIHMAGGHVAKIDARDIALAADFKWSALVKARTVYVCRCERVAGKDTTVYLHRAIMGATHGVQVDHVDGDGLNNCRGNLRLATASQNQWNRGKSRSNTSGFKGVYRDEARGKWIAEIRAMGKKRHLGRFDTPKEAHHAYRVASAALHGEFGRVA